MIGLTSLATFMAINEVGRSLKPWHMLINKNTPRWKLTFLDNVWALARDCSQ